MYPHIQPPRSDKLSKTATLRCTMLRRILNSAICTPGCSVNYKCLFVMCNDAHHAYNSTCSNDNETTNDHE